MADTSLRSPVLWSPPEGVRVRGTLALVAGSDESPRVYERFGRRLAFDGYTVGVFETAEASFAAEWLSAQTTTPRVLIGSDSGAAAVLTHADAADGIVLAGILSAAASGEPGAPSQRTACPVHLGVLGDPAARAVGDRATIPTPTAAELSSISIPVLAIHGGADEISPWSDARALLANIPDVEVIETVDGLHDALNDQSHRSVAASVVLWLERLRAAGVAAPIVRTSAA